MKTLFPCITLSKIASIYSGFAFKSDNLSKDGIPVIKIANIQNKKVQKQCNNFLPENLCTPKLHKYFLNKDDVLIAMTGSGSVGKMGKMRRIDRKYLVNPRVAIVRTNPEIADPEYIYQTLSDDKYEKILYGLGLGAGQPNVSPSEIGSLEIPFPSLLTQRKIATILSAYDDLIENNTRRIKILEEMAHALYREWFVKFRFPGHEKVGMVESEIGMVPKGWEIKRLEDVCLRITDGSHWSPKTVDDGYPMASVKDMNEWGFEISQCRKITKEDYEELIRNDCKPLKGDVLIAKDGSYLKHIFVTEKELELVILSSIAIIRPNNQILSHLLSLYLHEPSVKARMAGYVSGVAIPRIVLKDFRKFLIIVPDIDLQKKFFNLAEPMIKNCYRLIEKNANLRRTRDLLLPKLISGEVDMEKLDINIPAEAA